MLWRSVIQLSDVFRSEIDMNLQIDKWRILKNTTMIMQSNTVSAFVHLLYLSKFSSDGSCCIYGT